MDSVDTSLSPEDVGLPENSALTTPSTSINLQPPDDLPAGWATQPPRSAFYQVPVIIVFALTLTLVITVSIASCALLRRKRRSRRLKQARKETSSELEAGFDVQSDTFWSKQLRKQKGKWTRSSARWRSNAHVSIRRRRVRGTVDATSSTTVYHSPAESVEHLQVSDTPTMREASSFRLASLPPAYPNRNLEEMATELSVQGVEVPPPSPVPKPSTSPISSASESQHFTPPSPSRFGAHIATDDKAVLEQMANHASAPESQGVTNTVPQVPDWEEQETEIEAPESTAVCEYRNFPSPGSHIVPDILSAYDVDVVITSEISSLTPSSPQSAALPTLSSASAPPMEDDH